MRMNHWATFDFPLIISGQEVVSEGWGIRRGSQGENHPTPPNAYFSTGVCYGFSFNPTPNREKLEFPKSDTLSDICRVEIRQS